MTNEWHSGIVTWIDGNVTIIVFFGLAGGCPFALDVGRDVFGNVGVRWSTLQQRLPDYLAWHDVAGLPDGLAWKTYLFLYREPIWEGDVDHTIYEKIEALILLSWIWFIIHTLEN